MRADFERGDCVVELLREGFIIFGENFTLSFEVDMFEEPDCSCRWFRRGCFQMFLQGLNRTGDNAERVEVIA